MTRNPQDLKRYTPRERVNHWTIAVCFILLTLSGLSFFHPSMWPLTDIFGGGVWTRILHPYIGLVLTVAFALFFLRLRKHNEMKPIDWEWMKKAKGLMTGDAHGMPAQERYNGGQKILFWSLSACLLVMLLSGICIWRAWFNLPVVLVRLAAVLHAAAGAVMIGIVIGHIYLSIWTKGTIRAMVSGTVTRAWAKQHHALWYETMTGGRP